MANNENWRMAARAGKAIDNISKPRAARDRNNQEDNIMAFVNEYIPEADYEKYDLRRVCGEHNEAHHGHMHSRDWTIDRERDAFQIQVWSHRDSRFDGWAFYWKGVWMFFEMAPVDGEAKPDGSSCRFLFHVRGFAVPSELEMNHEELMSDLQAAITACPGSPTLNYAQRSITIEFIEE